MELTKKETNLIQGLSVLAMVWLHLFCRDFQGLFSPLIFIAGKPLSFYIAQLCDFCVMGFAFCSGYAHSVLYDTTEHYYKARLHSLLKLLIKFWVVLLAFSLVSVIAGNGTGIPGSWKAFLGNAFLFKLSYNGAWWYLLTYVLIVLLSPLLLRLSEKMPGWSLFGLGFVLYAIAYFVRFKVNSGNWFVYQFGLLGMTLFEYLLGVLFYRKQLFSCLYAYWCKIKRPLRILIAVVLFAAMLLVRTLLVPSLFAAPATGIVIICLFLFLKRPKWLDSALGYVGNHSTNIWLTHMFFYLVIFENLVYKAKYPLLIFGLMLLITLIVSAVLSPIQAFISKLIPKEKSRTKL